MHLSWMWLLAVFCLHDAWAGVGHEALAHAADIVERFGPRPAGSASASAVVEHVAATLGAHGWAPRVVQTGPRDQLVLACRDGVTPSVLLLLAHTDSVHARVPGANDNAAAVGALLTVAAHLGTAPARTVCLGFPPAEEQGLVGSRVLAREAASLLPGPLDLVVALDLVGRGRPTWTGLGPAWDAARLDALLEAFPADVPWVYRAVSAGMPGMERSDHAPFARQGIPAAQVLSRAESGIDWAYHSPRDTPDRLDPATLEQVVQGLLALARAPALPEGPGSTWAVVVPWTRIAVPGSWVRVFAFGLLVALVAGLREDRRVSPAGIGHFMGWGVLATVAALGAMLAAAWSREAGAALVPWIVGAGGLAWLGVWWRAGSATDDSARWLGAMACAVAAITLGGVGQPLLGVPVLVAGAGVAWSHRARVVGPVLAAWPAAYLLSPSSLRELAFHALVPASPSVWAVSMGLLGAPVAASLAWTPDRRAARRCAACSVVVVVASWTRSPWSEHFFETDRLAPLRVTHDGPARWAGEGQ